MLRAGLLLLAGLPPGLGLRRASLPEDPEPLRLSFQNQSSRARTETWSTLTLEEQSNLLQGSHYAVIGPETGYYVGFTPPARRIGLPALKMQDGSSGFRTTEPGTAGTTTTWPSLLAMAATWDEDLVEEVATTMGQEFRGKGANVMLGPSIAVQRTATSGRYFESLSGEDPYLGSRLARVFVRGVQSNNVMCVVKQIGFSEQETNRARYNALVDTRTAWELYYPPFEAAVEAGVGGIMCGYNKVNDTFACHNPELLKRDVRDLMGFQGMIVSQWGGVRGIDALENGVDIEMPGRNKRGIGKFNINQLVTVDRSVLQEATVHVRKAIYSVGLDRDRESCTPPRCTEKLWSQQRSYERTALANTAARNSLVLLKNTDNILPLNLNNISKLALLGSASQLAGTGMITNADYVSGGGSSHSNSKGIATLLDLVKQRVKWQETVELVTIPEVVSNIQAMTKLATVADADVIVVVVGATSTELADRLTLSLDDAADDFIRAIGFLNKPTIVLMETPGPVTTPWRDDQHVKAIANLFLAGEGTAKAWAGMLFGDYSPSGKLPVMFPATPSDVLSPSFTMTVNYSEGLFTSYRNSKFRAAFPFGHGLTYTTFTLSQPRQVSTNCSALACVQVTVANVGKRAAAEVPQAYVEFAPELREPKLILKGFEKVYLRPGESKDVVFGFQERDLSVYRTEFGWMQQKVVRVRIGTSSSKLGDPIVVKVKRAEAPEAPVQPRSPSLRASTPQESSPASVPQQVSPPSTSQESSQESSPASVPQEVSPPSTSQESPQATEIPAEEKEAQAS